MTVVARPEDRGSGGAVAKAKTAPWRFLTKDGESMSGEGDEGTYQAKEECERGSVEGEWQRGVVWPEAKKKAKSGRFDGSKTNRLGG